MPDTSRQSSYEDYGIVIPASRRNKGGEVDVTCPQCSSGRKKRKALCLSVNLEKEVWLCWHCGWKGNLQQGETEKSRPPKIETYRKPEVAIVGEDKDRPESLFAYFEKRGITREVVVRNDIRRGLHWMVVVEEKVPTIQFPVKLDGEIVNVKYRDKDKNFQMVGGAMRAPFGIDDCDGKKTICICEGEGDKLSIEVAGYTSCFSMPDGAPTPDSKNLESKFDFLQIEKVARIIEHADKVILAVDNDPPGLKAQEELAARIGRDKCWLVQYPEGCKDSNDVLVKHGADALRMVIESATPYPLEDVVEVSDISDQIDLYYEGGQARGLSTGIASLDPIYTLKPGTWTAVTGSPKTGKSAWLDQICLNAAIEHGWKTGICSFEADPVEHTASLCEKYSGRPFHVPPIPGYSEEDRMTPEEREIAKDFICDHFKFIRPQSPTMDSILEIAKSLVLRYGIKILVIDPYNQMEHSRPSNMTQGEYISQILGKLGRFCKTYNVLAFFVAHPTKLKKIEVGERAGLYPVPTMYDIAESASFYSKCDFGISLWRDTTSPDSKVEVYVQATKYRWIASVGMANVWYDEICGRYYSDEESLKKARRVIKPIADTFKLTPTNPAAVSETPRTAAFDDEDEDAPF